MSNLETSTENNTIFQWTWKTVLQSIVVFAVAGVAEIVGGWMVWVTIRGNANEKRPWWFALIGSFVLVVYGFIPTFQPTESFGRIYAVYGGFFIVMSFLFGWLFDGDKPDLGGAIGGLIALVGVLVVMFWPR